ncbi:MAG TPA: carboxypeptidase-like regulatory domain-containing protein [Vicinamibacterales bacterium]|nr:carboxypeptidase-like regulatory domain-containing protein [Vicinamibacterales bacterium]
MRRSILFLLSLALAAAVPQAFQGQTRGGQRPARDTAQQQTPQGTAVIGGRVLVADTGRPLKRARVMVSAPAIRMARAATTDDQGQFAITGLLAGSYTIRASKAGYVDAVYGQRRPLQPGVPVELSDGQQLTTVSLRLLRGGVITGHVVDQDGEPLARTTVNVLRYQYVRGERALTPAGSDQSDDRGEYRVFGLPPGQYFVSANAAGADGPLRGFARGGRGGFFGQVDAEPEPAGYAPTYFPGVTMASEATRVDVVPGQETEGIDFQLQLVPTATVRGTVLGAPGDTVPVTLTIDDGNGGAVRGQMFRAMSTSDGTFQIPNVPPGRYTAVARSGGRWDDPKIARQLVSVNGQNITGLMLTLVSAITVSGNITVESSGTPAPTDYSKFSVDFTSLDPQSFGPGGRGGRRGGRGDTGTGAEKNGEFVAEDVLPGLYLITAQAPSPWTLKSVTVGGRDVTDLPVDIHGGQDVANVAVVVADRTTGLDGIVRDDSGAPVAGLTVIAFAGDPQYWRPESRHVQATRTDQNGAYHLRGLPAGDYLIAVEDDVQTGEWYDPSYLQQIRNSATPLTLADGDKRTEDLKAPAQGSGQP